MAISPGSKEPVILFTHGDTAYEYLAGRGLGPNGESLVEAQAHGRGCWWEGALEELAHPGRDAVRPQDPGPPGGRGQAGRVLRHPAILCVEGPYEAQETLYTVVEHAPGIRLTDLVTLSQARGQYPSEAFTLYLGATLASALGHAHTGC